MAKKLKLDDEGGGRESTVAERGAQVYKPYLRTSLSGDVYNETPGEWENPTPEQDKPWWQNSPIYNETPFDDDDGNPEQDIYVPGPNDYSKRTSPSQEYFDLISRMGGSPNGGTNGNKGDKGDDGKTPIVNQGNADITPAMAYLQQMQGMIDGIDLDKFKFDLNGEELYQQYRDQYLRNGRLAMMDTMGQAAGLTGGYGSSYAQNAGQQAYQGYVNELNAVVPQVYDRAYQRWGDEQDLKLRKYQLMADQYGRLLDQEDRDYTRQYNADKLAAQERESERKYAYDTAKLEADTAKDREAALIKSGAYTYGPDGSLLYIGDYRKNDDGTYSDVGNDVEDIHGISDVDIARTIKTKIDNLYFGEENGMLPALQRWIAENTEGGSGIGLSFGNNVHPSLNSVAYSAARLLAKENEWDNYQTAYAASVILAMLSNQDNVKE